MMKQLTQANKICYYIMISILLMYIFRGFFSVVGLGNLVYIMTFIVFGICLMRSSGKIIIHRDTLLFYISGIIAFLYSVITKELLSSLVGVFAIFFNLATWQLFICILNIDERRIVFKSYIKVLIAAGIITAILGIYQTFIDASLGGFAINEIYSNNELMSSGRFVRRAIGLLGSSQNYGLFVGVCFVFALHSDFKKNIYKYSVLGILLFGIIVSGSRASSVCIIIGLFSIAFKMFHSKRISAMRFTGILIIVPIFTVLMIEMPNYFDSRTLHRLYTFSLSDVAKGAYQSVFTNINFTEILFGRGLGYRSWVVQQFLGTSRYEMIFKSPYQSVESSFLFVFSQCGILGFMGYVQMMLRSIMKSYRINYTWFSALLCVIINQMFTPSFTGMAMSFTLWPLILCPLFDIDTRAGEYNLE